MSKDYKGLANHCLAFNSSLAVLGVLLINRMPTYSADLSGFSVTELRALLDSAIEILHGLDGGNKTMMRCRDTLAQLLTAFDVDGTYVGNGRRWVPWLTIIVHTGHAPGFTPASFSLSPTSAWAWQLMDPGMFGSELSLGLEHEGGLNTAYASQLPGGFEVP